MKKIRILTLASVFALSGLMTGCFEDSTSSSAPTINQFESANFDESKDTLAINTKLDFYGKVSDDEGLKSWTLQVLDASGKVVSTATVPTISGTSTSFDLPSKSSVNLSVTNDGTWGATGKYSVVLTVTNAQGNSIKATQTIIAKGNGTTNPTTLTSSTVTLGGSSSSFGSYLDADAMVVYKSSEAAANAAAIDLVFNYTNDASLANEIRSPSDASWLTWGTKNSTKIVDVTGDATFETTNTQAAIDALYSASAAETTIYAVGEGDVLVVHTSTGKNVLIKINSISNDGKATIEFSVKGYK